jgi:hypothetical protein
MRYPTQLISILGLSLLLIPAIASAQSIHPAPPPNPPHYPIPDVDVGPAHPTIPDHHTLVQRYNDGTYSLKDMRSYGLSVFATPFNSYDGYGDGAYWSIETEPLMPGQRPTLQGNGLTLRVNGLDSRNCNECHGLVSNRTRIPTLGLGGVGDISTNVLFMPSLIDVADSTEEGVVFLPHPLLKFERDGVADFNGRYINPPFLFGGAGVELIAKEMTDDLQRIREYAKHHAGLHSLTTHDVDFGYLASDGNGYIDYSHVVGITDPEELVIRPFGRKGERFSMRDFDNGAMNFHFGIQPVEFLKSNDLPSDADGDHYSEELTIGEMTALHFFAVCNPKPEIRFRTVEEQEQAEEGESIAGWLGCFECHRPFLISDRRELPFNFDFERYKEDELHPFDHVYAKVDMVGQLDFDPWPGAGVIVPLFADLKRHDMGERLKETAEDGGEDNYMFTTARLWGVADTAPYLHDGRATTLYQAIWFHDGEAAEAREEFMRLPSWQQSLVLWFLKTLRTPEHPNEDLLPLVLPD